MDSMMARATMVPNIRNGRLAADDITTIANDVYVMQNGNLYTPRRLIGPYAGTNATPAPAAKRTSRAASRKIPVWETPGEVGKSVDIALQQLC